VALIIRLILIPCMFVGLYFSAHGYYSGYYLVAATQGEKSLAEYERLLRRAIEHDATNGRARMEIARLLYAQKKFEAARSEELLAMESFRPLSAYELLGITEEKLGESAAGEGKAAHLANAKRLFEKAERVRPGNTSALERLMLMAFKSGNDAELEVLARQVTRSQADNVNATYVTAVAAERAGNLRAAYGRYQRITSLRELPKGTIFTTATVSQLLTDIRNRMEPRG
jgi:lipopolysaccharide biosynthesis regulator YciM